MSKKDLRRIPLKNYFIFVGVLLIVCLIVLYFVNWYKVYEDYQMEIPVIEGHLADITVEEVDHYVVENPTTILYMCTSYDKDCRDFEEKFIRYLEDEKLNDTVVYLNLNDVDLERFVDDFNKKYNYRVKLDSNYPAIVIFEGGSIIDMLQVDGDDLTITKTDNFFSNNKEYLEADIYMEN